HKEGVRAEVPAYVENAAELVDEPGEFYYDIGTRVFRYRPREGEDMKTVAAITGGPPSPVSLTCWPDHGVCGASPWFEGITFADIDSTGERLEAHVDVQANYCLHTAENTFGRDGAVAALHNEYEKTDSGMTLGGTFLENDMVFSRCVFTRFSQGGLWIVPHQRKIVLHRCLFEDIGGTAVTIGGVEKRDHHPTSWFDRHGDVVISECVFRNCGVEYEGSVGVFVGYANGVVIARNEFYDLPYSAISVGWGWGEEDAGGGAYDIPFRYATPTPCGANRILDNHIHHVMQKRDDGAAVYTLGNQPGTLIRGNHIHDNGPGGPGGVYLDEGSGFIEVTGNRVYNVKRPMNFNNHAQDRRATCFVHDNDWDDTLNN
ncbi:MAG TPA: right-handed parallel beta-helix repeat-containing protein, partial [Candidatus Hydrogenedentes bacterium]|nr:right-handed parallel beta-helix repeat-containing protein [Candidatus Hydrogenedentota bacterium]